MTVKSILVVDDEDLICQFLQDGLTTHGFEVQTALTIKDAYDLATTVEFDLIITDVIMDEGDGFELLQMFRDKELPIIVMSGGGKMNANDYLGMASGLGAYATLQKPFELKKLIDLINAVPAQA